MAPDQLNNAAYALADKLNDAMDKELQASPQPMQVVLGAANALLASALTNAPSKAAALEAAESCFAIIRGAINTTPDEMFASAPLS